MSASELQRLQNRRAKLQREMEAIKQADREIEARHRKAARNLDRDQCLLLGRAQKQDAAKDPRYAARVVLRLHSFCTRDRDRERFQLGRNPLEAGLDWVSDDCGFQTRVREEMRKLLDAARGAQAGSNAAGGGQAAASQGARPRQEAANGAKPSGQASPSGQPEATPKAAASGTAASGKAGSGRG